MSRLSGQHIPRATVRGAINSLPRPEGDNLFRLRRSSPAPDRMTLALRQGPVRAGGRTPPAWPGLHRAGPRRAAMVAASVCTSPNRGRQPPGLSLFQRDVSLLLLKPCQEAERHHCRLAAGCSSGAGPHLGTYPSILLVPTKVQALLALWEEERLENVKVL